MNPVISCSISNTTVIPGAACSVRKNTSLTRCSSSRKHTRCALPSQRFILPLSTCDTSFPRYRIGHALHRKLGVCIFVAGTDVAVEESSSPVNSVETSEGSISESDSSDAPTQSKRTRSLRKSEMPPVKDEELVPGAMFTGKVRSVQPFGAFVDFGAFTDGLVHVSKLSDNFVKDVATFVSVGQEVKVRLVEVNTESGRISLSMRENDDANKRQQQKDGSTTTDRPRPARKNASRPGQKSTKFAQGQDLDGTVKNLARSGAFISLPEGEEGFLPTSEESDDGLMSMMGEPSLHVGQEVKVRVLRITRGQVTLTMKKDEDNDKLDSQLSQGVVHTATNPFMVAFRKNEELAAFLDQRETLEKTKVQAVEKETEESSEVPLVDVVGSDETSGSSGETVDEVTTSERSVVGED